MIFKKKQQTIPWLTEGVIGGFNIMGFHLDPILLGSGIEGRETKRSFSNP